MNFEYLTDVHTTGDAQRVEDDIDGGAVFHEGHVLDGEDFGNNTLVTVAACQLIADGDLALLGNVDADQLVDAAGQVFVVVFAVEDTDADNGTGLTVGNLE